MSLVRLTEGNIEKIQIDEGIVVFELGEEKEKILAPTRGGAEFTAQPKIRDIEYDGKRGKTMGLQVKDSEDVTLKINTLDCSKETLAKAIPNAVIKDNKVEQGDFGVIKPENYIKKISIITQTLDGKFQILHIRNAMHEGNFAYKAVQGAENEHNLEFIGHYDYKNINEKIWYIEETDTNPIELD